MAFYYNKEGYVITEKPFKNQVIISLPPTGSTISTSTEPLSDRKVYLDSADAALILSVIQQCYEHKED